jgi:restriction system protein
MDVTYVFYKELANASPRLAPLVGIILLLTAAVSAANSFRKRQTPFSNHFSRKSPASRKSFIHKPAEGPDSLPQENLQEKPLISNPGSLNGNFAALDPYRTTYSQRNPIESEMVKGNVDLSIETLKKIEWFSFELLCKIYYECVGYKVTKTKAGADGGVDLLLYMKDTTVPYALIQCKARTHGDVGVKYTRELLGVMTSQKVDKGILITNAGYTNDALEFANANRIELIDVFKLRTMFDELDADKKKCLIDFLESTDFTTPTCPNCEVKLVERIAKKGTTIGQKFWGCINYPRCRYSLPMSKLDC